jgi:multiple sugar transport system permease protein
LDSATITRSPAAPATTVKSRKRPLTVGRVVLYVFVTLTALVWLFPVVWALLNSFRDYAYTSVHGSPSRTT